MKKEEIEKTVHQILMNKLGIDSSEVTSDARLDNDLGADSLDAIEIVREIEKRFNIDIPDDEIENAAIYGSITNLTVQQLVDITAGKVL